MKNVQNLTDMGFTEDKYPAGTHILHETAGLS